MTKFTKEQLSGLARENVRVLTLAAKQHPGQPVIAMDLRLAEIALAALTAEAEVWEIENPGEGTFYSAHPPRDFEKASCVYYRLPLLEGLK